MGRASVSVLAIAISCFASSLLMAGGHQSRTCCSAYPSAPPRASLLFSPARSSYVASDFAYRTDWPSTNNYYQTGQVIYFNERFYDRQGPGPNRNWTYRQFDTYRSGFGYR